MKKVSIKDIAKLSGVSVATVSRVINNNGRFSEETKKKVLDIIDQTGYQTNYSAKSLRMNKSFSIGILVPDISNYFFSHVVQKIEEQLFEKGYSTIICNTSRNHSKEQAYIKMLEGKMIDGIIIISGVQEFDLSKELNYSHIPYVCIDREPGDKKNTVFISSNHYQGGLEATNLLCNAGAQNLLMVTYTRQSSSSKERLRGFKDSLKQHRKLFDEKKNTYTIDFSKSDWQDMFFQHIIKYKIDSIFAVNDNIAIRLVNFFNQKKIKIPEQLQIIGFDNIPIGQYLHPSLTSINQNIESIAKNTVKNLLLAINGEKSNLGAEYIVPIQLIKRNSTR